MNLIEQFESVTHFIGQNKMNRVSTFPLKYWNVLMTRHFNKSKKGVLKNAITFWGEPIHVVLPASADIYLSGAKTHDSEVRLTKFIMKNIKEKDVVFDIGAHIGFFTLLFSHLAKKGMIHAFEASPNTFKILSLNTQKHSNICLNHVAIHDQKSSITFFEFPAHYAEYNSLLNKQYENEAWYDENKPKEVEINAITIDDYCIENKIIPAFIKIDIEGAEDKAMLGATNILTQNDVTIAMEYLSPLKHNKAHKKAATYLLSLAYNAHLILNNGNLQKIVDIDEYLLNHHIDSENIIFIKQSSSS